MGLFMGDEQAADNGISSHKCLVQVSECSPEDLEKRGLIGE